MLPISVVRLLSGCLLLVSIVVHLRYSCWVRPSFCSYRHCYLFRWHHLFDVISEACIVPGMLFDIAMAVLTHAVELIFRRFLIDCGGSESYRCMAVAWRHACIILWFVRPTMRRWCVFGNVNCIVFCYIIDDGVISLRCVCYYDCCIFHCIIPIVDDIPWVVRRCCCWCRCWCCCCSLLLFIFDCWLYVVVVVVFVFDDCCYLYIVVRCCCLLLLLLALLFLIVLLLPFVVVVVGSVVVYIDFLRCWHSVTMSIPDDVYFHLLKLLLIDSLLLHSLVLLLLVIVVAVVVVVVTVIVVFCCLLLMLLLLLCGDAV